MLKNATTRWAAYVRTSTLDQEKGIDSQERALRDWFRGRGVAPEEVQWYRDRLSGKDLNRPDFEAMQKAIQRGKVNAVVVWSLDRISRTLLDGLNVMGAWLKDGVRVVSVTQDLDFAGTIGQMIASLLFGLGQMQREALRENTKRGLRAAVARGTKLGRPVRVHAVAVRRLLEGGMQIQEAAEHLGVSRQAVHRCLRRAGTGRLPPCNEPDHGV